MPLTRAYLQSRGVRLVDFNHLRLECLACGQHWSPMLGDRGRLPRGYFYCPNRCNEGSGISRVRREGRHVVDAD